VSDLDKKSHHEALSIILITLDVSPEYVTRRYMEAVLEEEDFNITRAAARMHMHRRTLQRNLAKRRPHPRRQSIAVRIDS